jgi:threonine dehydratase
MNAPLVTLDEIRDAARRLAGSLHRTPLLSARRVGEAAGLPTLLVKAEVLQRTGSFKARGALNHVLQLGAEARRRGVVTVSAGNHAAALAWAADSAGVPCTVVMPAGASPAKAAAARGYGARVVLHGTVFDAFQRALDLQDSEGLSFVHPFDDPAVVAGQGTVALEIAADAPAPGTVVVPVGGGGLIAGVAAALRGLDPAWTVVGVEPEGACAMVRSLEAGRPVRLDRVDTIADGLAAPMAGDLPFLHVSEQVSDVVTVSDDAIRRAVAMLLANTKLLVEPAGAAGVAALLEGRVPLRGPGPAIAILCGGNLDLSRLTAILRDTPSDGTGPTGRPGGGP